MKSPSELESHQLSRRSFMQGALLALGGVAAVEVLTSCAPIQDDKDSLDSEEVTPSENTDVQTNNSEAEQSMEQFSDTITWSQEFKEQTKLDTSVWRFDTDPEVPTYNNEEQAYTTSPDNVRIEPGVGLVLEAHRETYQYPDADKIYEFTSGKVDTKESFSFEYGKIEARMKMPVGNGPWPAFWMLSQNQVNTKSMGFTDEDYETDRGYMYDSELDVVEVMEAGYIEATAHTYDASPTGKIPFDATDGFHIYGVELTPSSITWTVDGEPYHYFEKPAGADGDDIAKWPFGRGNQLYVILNLAMGGDDIPEIDDDIDSAQLLVEHVRFYDYIGEK